MPQNSSNSLINLDNLSKPADTLIKKVSDAVDGFFAPYQVKRMAKAGAEAEIMYHSPKQVTKPATVAYLGVETESCPQKRCI